jgi:hypothetical protein
MPEEKIQTPKPQIREKCKGINLSSNRENMRICLNPEPAKTRAEGESSSHLTVQAI